MNWQELSATSHYKTALAIHHELQHGNPAEADKGIQALINALSRSEKRAFKSQLIRLMKHIIKWQMQPDYRSRSWVASIHNARAEIKDIQEETPSLNNNVIEQLWDDCLASAIVEAEDEMRQDTNVEALSWQAVFEQNYSLNSQKKKRYTLAELVAQCDPSLPLTTEEQDWLDSPACGLEYGAEKH